MDRNDAVSVSCMDLIRFGLTICLLLGACTAHAQYKFTKKITPHVLQRELVAAGFNVSPELGIACSNDDCEIFWGPTGETKDPTAVIASHVYKDKALIERQERAALRVLVEKWVAGTITAAEKDNLLKRLVVLLLAV